MSGDRLTRTVREQVALGRLLPLGDGDDPVWITERAAVLALRRGCAALPGARLGSVAVLLQDGDAHDGGAHDGDALDGGPDRGAQDGGPDRGAPDRGHPDRGRPGLDAAPLGALPHGPLRITAAFEASAAEPLPATAERLRQALFTAAREGLGLAVEVVDLEVAGLLDEGDEGVDEEGSGAESHGRAGVAEEAAPLPGPGRRPGPAPGRPCRTPRTRGSRSRRRCGPCRASRTSPECWPGPAACGCAIPGRLRSRAAGCRCSWRQRPATTR